MSRRSSAKKPVTTSKCPTVSSGGRRSSRTRPSGPRHRSCAPHSGSGPRRALAASRPFSASAVTDFSGSVVGSPMWPTRQTTPQLDEGASRHGQYRTRSPRSARASSEVRGANGGAKRFVAPRCWPSYASPDVAETRRPALVCAGRVGLRIESSTTELRWRPPNLAVGCSTRYSTASARWRTWPRLPYRLLAGD